MIDSVDQPKLTHNEALKASDPLLAGRIAPTLDDDDADHFSKDDYEFLKFHGIYQQDDRDQRKQGKKYIFMVRGRLPGGVLTADQYLAFDRLSTEVANDTLRVTTRQSFQFHGVVKAGLRPLIAGLHSVLATTLGACGDVCRNVLAPPASTSDTIAAQLQADAKRVSDALLPATPAYHEIWVGDKRVIGGEGELERFQDPVYGTEYLPRKFKIAFARPPRNDVDILSNCLGFIAVVESGELVGYNVVAGGGMGKSHNNATTFPRVADLVGYIPAQAVVELSCAVAQVFREHGDRTDRKHARLKYVLEEKGCDWFREKVEQAWGAKFEDPRPYEFRYQTDSFGWQPDGPASLLLGLFIENGRIADRGTYRLKSAIRQVVEEFRTTVQLTPAQNLQLVGLPSSARDAVEGIFRTHGVDLHAQGSALRRASMACPALPTCGLALAESERRLPGFISEFEGLLQELGMADEEITVRMTGCPNGCARPYLAEIGLVGRAPGKYQLYLGGNEASTRLNRLAQDSVKDGEVMGILRSLLERFRTEREGAERFGDWSFRSVVNNEGHPADQGALG